MTLRSETRLGSGEAPTDRIWGIEAVTAAGASGPVVGAAGTHVFVVLVNVNTFT